MGQDMAGKDCTCLVVLLECFAKGYLRFETAHSKPSYRFQIFSALKLIIKIYLVKEEYENIYKIYEYLYNLLYLYIYIYYIMKRTF